MSGAVQQMLLAEAAAAAGGDPYYANTVFIWEAEGANNQNSGLVEARNSRAITCAGTGKLSTTQARLGSTSLFVGTGGASLAPHADWSLGNSSNASPFTIEFSAFEGTLNTWEAITVWNGSEKSWWIRINTDGTIRLLASSTGTTAFSMDVTATGFGFTVGVQNDCCIEKDTSGKLRFYRNGIMKFSTTPANSVFFPSTNSPLAFGTQGTSDGYLDHIRMTKAARFQTDTSYTFDAFPFPTS